MGGVPDGEQAETAHERAGGARGKGRKGSALLRRGRTTAVERRVASSKYPERAQVNALEYVQPNDIPSDVMIKPGYH